MNSIDLQEEKSKEHTDSTTANKGKKKTKKSKATTRPPANYMPVSIPCDIEAVFSPEKYFKRLFLPQIMYIVVKN